MEVALNLEEIMKNCLTRERHFFSFDSKKIYVYASHMKLWKPMQQNQICQHTTEIIQQSKEGTKKRMLSFETNKNFKMASHGGMAKVGSIVEAVVNFVYLLVYGLTTNNASCLFSSFKDYEEYIFLLECLLCIYAAALLMHMIRTCYNFEKNCVQF